MPAPEPNPSPVPLASPSPPPRSALARHPRSVCALVFVLAAVCAALLIWTLERRDRAEHRAHAGHIAGDHAQALQRALEQALSANNALAALVRQGQGRVPDFAEIGTQMLPLYPGVAAMGLSPGGVVRQVVPLKGNERSIGFDPLNDPLQGAESQRARASGLLTLAGPMALVQGGLGVIGRQPVYLEGAKNGSHAQDGPRFWGFTYTTIRLPELLAAARLQQLAERGYHYRLWRIRPDNGQQQQIAASTPAPGADAVSRSLTLPNGQWTLSLAPAAGWSGTGGSEEGSGGGAGGVLALRAALGLLFAGLMAWLARLLCALQAHRRGLACEVAQRTAEMRATQQQLRATIDAIPDLLFEVDQDGRCCDVHSQRAQLLLAPRERLIGASVSEMLPASAARTVLAALAEAQAQGWSGGSQIVLNLPQLGATWFELSVAPKPVAPGALPRCIVLARDISERKRTQEQLQLTAQVFDQSSEAIVIADATQTMVRTNRAFARITGYTEAEAVGQSVCLLSQPAAGTGDFDARAVYARITGASGPQRAGAQAQADQTGPANPSDQPDHPGSNTAPDPDGADHWEGEAWGRRKDGSSYPQWLSVSRVRDARGAITHSITLFRDITLQREALARIQRMAHFDALTGLPNRALLAERTQAQIAAAQAAGSTLALLFLDLDHFKNVNDSLGHRIGDILLVAVAQRLQALLRPQDTCARLGGDEFILLLPGACGAQAAQVATSLLAALAQPFVLEPYELSTTLSVGIALYPADGDGFDTLYQRADAAMYRAKHGGRNRYGLFTAELEARSARTLQIENALRRALERGQFELRYQPQVSLRSGQVVGAEALLRWQHPQLGSVAPAEFIPVAEASGMIVAIGEWVLLTAARQARLWLDQQLPLRAISVNLSAVQFRHPQLTEMIGRCLQQAGLPARRLELELTEGAAVDDPAAALAVMNQLHAHGLSLALDDFGTGYSSLGALKRFHIDKLKIDQSFVRDLDGDANDRAIVSAIIRMAQALGMLTTAEGVETDGQLEFLREQGCDEVQGYLFSRPLPVAAFEAYLRANLVA